MSQDERLHLRLSEARKAKLVWYSRFFGEPVTEIVLNLVDALPDPKMCVQKDENSKDQN
jgi:hypothetical protein